VAIRNFRRGRKAASTAQAKVQGWPAARQVEQVSLDGVIARLRAVAPGLSPTLRRIADFILNNAADVVHMSVTEVAERANASEGSVVALCQHIGAKGFQQIKIALARDLVQPVQFIHEDLNGDDTTERVIEKIFRSNLQALEDTLRVLDASIMEQAVDAILRAKRVEVYGIGSAAPVAEDVNYRLLRIGIESKVVVDSHVQAISASLTGPDVTTLTMSHSGSTLETVTATRLAKDAGATTICVTNFGKSPIQRYADIVLHTMAKETRFRTEAMTSRIAQLAVVDTLIAAVALRTHDRAVATIEKTFEILAAKRF